MGTEVFSLTPANTCRVRFSRVEERQALCMGGGWAGIQGAVGNVLS